MNRVLIGAVALVVAIVAVYGGSLVYRKRAAQALVDGTVAALKPVSARLTSSLARATSEPVDYRDSLRHVGEDIEALERRVQAVQAASTTDVSQWLDPEVVYLRAGQAMLRQEAEVLKDQSGLESMAKVAKERNLEGVELQLNRKAALEYATELRTAGARWRDSVKDLRAAREALTTFVPADHLVDLAVLQKAQTRAEQAATLP